MSLEITDNLRPASPTSSVSSFRSSESQSSNHARNTYSLEEQVITLKALKDDDLSDEKAILALPRRRPHSQRPLAFQLAKYIYPELSEMAAIIQYERLTTFARTLVRQAQKERLLAQLYPTSNEGGKLIRVQGPWKGQLIEPMDLKGPLAIPMPVEIGKTEDFDPIFGYLASNVAFEDEAEKGTRGIEILWKNPLVEFNRGIVYQDGRLDLCKKVVGPTHIGSLMDSLESNTHIRHFLLGNNVISTTGSKRIAEFIQKFPIRMETWYLAGCHITRHGLSLLATQMIKSSTITNLWFKRNPFGPNSSGILAELVLRTPNLRTLDLETVELGDFGTKNFIEAITGKVAALKHLYLNANGIGESACASLSKYLADPHCRLESLFLSTNPLGDAGIIQLASGIAKNKSLIRLTCASAGLTSKGVACLAAALCDGDHPLQALDLSASQTTMVHGQKFNYIDDDCIEALKGLIMSPSMRWLDLGRTVFSEAGMQEVKSVVARSELVFIGLFRVLVTQKDRATQEDQEESDGNTEMLEAVNPPKSCSLEVRKQLAKNQAKYFPQFHDYDKFLNSDDIRFLRNTSDVRKIDSMYRTRDKRLGLPMDGVWEENDPTWKLITDDAALWEKSDMITLETGL